jgi:hypothetical protein
MGGSGTEPFCVPMMLDVVGPCEIYWGAAWSGQECVELHGCECLGPDCNETFDTWEGCMSVYEECL